MNNDDFKKRFPALSKEIELGQTQTFRVSGVRQEIKEEIGSKKGQGHSTFMPDVVDYIRRCDTIEQALEIVDFLLKQKEINISEAKSIKHQLKTQGLRSFGSKKEVGHYLQHGIG